MPELQRLRADHASAVLAFELANRAYFAASVSDSRDEFYDQFTEQHNALLAEQETGTCAFHVLVGENGSVLGRFNLVDIEDGTAELGARVLSVLGSTASTHRPRALPHSSTARAAREYARAVAPDRASTSASCSSPCALRAAAQAHADSWVLLAALTARRSTLPA